MSHIQKVTLSSSVCFLKEQFGQIYIYRVVLLCLSLRLAHEDLSFEML